MLTVVQLLDLARERISTPTDYRLSKVLGVTQTTLIGWRKGRSKPEPLTMARLAAVCGVDAKRAVLWLQMERASTNSERELWASVAQAVEDSDMTPLDLLPPISALAERHIAPAAKSI